MEATIDDLLTYRDAVLSMEAQARNLLKDYARRFPFTSNSSDPEYRRYKRQCEAGISLERAAHYIEILRQAQQRLHELDARIDVSVTIRRTVGLKAPPIFVGSASYPTGHEAAVALGEAALNAWDRSGAAGVIDTWTRAGDASSGSWGTTGGPWGNSNGGAHALDALKHLARRLSRLRRHAPPDLSGRIEQEFWEAANDLPPDEGFYRWLAEHPERPVATQLAWDKLTPEDFERLVFSLVSDESGYENPQWLTRTNAPDRGRDISVFRVFADALGGTIRHRVIIQCRHWLTKSVALSDISSLRDQMKLWESPRVDVHVIATTGRFTSDAVAFVERHNQSDTALRVEMWPESHLERLLARRPELIATYGLR
jgi:hypothetical protein